MSEFLEEVKFVFSYLVDEYKINIISWHNDSAYLHISETFMIGDSTNNSVNDISDLLESSKKITSLLESVMDCMVNLSISGDLYHNIGLSAYGMSNILVDFDTSGIHLTLSRTYFAESSRLVYPSEGELQKKV